jgi:hypothetical protein
MAATDFRINAAVRRVFVRHWLDLRCIDYQTVNCVVTIRGRFKKLKEAVKDKQKGDAVETTAMVAIEQELSKIPNVKRINMNVMGWTKLGGKWIQGG